MSEIFNIFFRILCALKWPTGIISDLLFEVCTAGICHIWHRSLAGRDIILRFTTFIHLHFLMTVNCIVPPCFKSSKVFLVHSWSDYLCHIPHPNFPEEFQPPGETKYPPLSLPFNPQYCVPSWQAVLMCLIFICGFQSPDQGNHRGGNSHSNSTFGSGYLR